MSNHTIIRLRRGTAAEWAASEPQPGGEILKLGEPGYEKDTGKLKIGDGTTPWNSLGYVAGGSSIDEEQLQDLLGNNFFNSGIGITLEYDDDNDNLTISVDPTLPYLELTNNALVVLPVVLGEPVEFTRSAEGNEQDQIDEGLTLARDSNQALYNAETQEGYNSTTHAIDGAEWNSGGWGELLDLPSRSYTTLRSALNNAIGENIVGAELIMHDTINDKYYKFSFSDWGQNNGGSFAYTRTLIVSNPNYFEKSDYGSEVDIFIADDPEGYGVGITRGENQGIYNPYQEEGWTSENSPLGTEWNNEGWNDLSDVESRTYTNFYDAVGGQLGDNVVGSQLIMRIVDSNTYYAIKFLGWTQNNAGGGFSYVKYLIDLDQIQEGVTFADGTVLKSAAGIGPIKSTASNNRRIEEVYGNKTVSVTEQAYVNLTTTTSRAVTDDNRIYISTVDSDIYDITDHYNDYVDQVNELEFSLDNSTWYKWNGSGSVPENEFGYFFEENPTLTYNQGDTVYFRYLGGGQPVVWWDKNELPGGASGFRGATIDYHGFTGEGTFIGTIHIVDDDGEENITHTEVSSGSSDSENDDLWFVQNEGTISYRRMDGEAKTLKIQWSAKVFYGSELYD